MSTALRFPQRFRVPRTRVGSSTPEEGILYADCNLELAIQMKLRHDFAGHYNRPDIFQLHVNRAAPQLYHVYNAELPQQLATDAPSVLPQPAARLAPPESEPQ
jgi:aliphatic nitrilase